MIFCIIFREKGVVLAIKPRIYTVATAHLDTSWNWDLETTIREYLPRTIRNNLPLFGAYPDYIFNFEGAYRYELMEEYDPEGFALLQQAVAEGRWRVAGSAYENGDVNIPSPEALFRNILYGNAYFAARFGCRSKDIFLPDCFGFGWALPSVAAHANLLGFSTQKLCWSGAYGIPFDLGVWRGPDGAAIYASLDGRAYDKGLKQVRKHPARKKLENNLKQYDLPFTFLYHGVGDRGGAPRETSVQTVHRESSENENQAVEVLFAGSDDIFRDMAALPPELQAKLPVWENELVMSDHGVGGYTSRAVGKRWNRRAEQLAEAAERSCLQATLLGLRGYPADVLDTCWKRVIAHQFHDDLPGTSLVDCYRRNWNDYMLSLNQLGEEYRFSAACMGRALDSSFVRGHALLVGNPLQFPRRETVVAALPLPAEHVRVFDGKGAEVPAQLLSHANGRAEVAFCAEVPAFGWAVYDLRTSDRPCPLQTGLSVTAQTLENQFYKLTIDENGDIARIHDKEYCCELLQAPIRMALHDYDGSQRYPAWELDYKEVMAKPREYAAKPRVEIVANGPARVALRIMRTAGASRFLQTISLDSASRTIRCDNEIDWRSLRTLLKTEFSLHFANEEATYDLGLGTIQRGNSRKNLYEVPAQMWADLSLPSGFYGVTVFSDSKCGWDKPDDHTLRLTGIHTPRAAYNAAQHQLDLGLNRYAFGICGHSGPWQNGSQRGALCFNSPLAAFSIPASAGPLGHSYSFAHCDNDAVLVRALKQALETEEIIVRFNEGAGETQDSVNFSLDGGILSAREIYASEEDLPGTQFSLEDGKLRFSMGPYQVRSFALTVNAGGLALQSRALGRFAEAPLPLPCNLNAVTSNEQPGDGVMPNGYAIPAERFPAQISSGGITFATGAGRDGVPNALVCAGQSLPLPKGAAQLHLLAAACGGDTRAGFQLGDQTYSLTIQDNEERIGAWDLYSAGETAYVKPDRLGWNSTHAHNAAGDVPAKQLCFFHYTFPCGNAESCLLPENPNVVLLAATVTNGEPEAFHATALYDGHAPCASLAKRPCDWQISPKQEKLARKKGFFQWRSTLKFRWGYAKRRIRAARGRR